MPGRDAGPDVASVGSVPRYRGMPLTRCSVNAHEDFALRSLQGDRAVAQRTVKGKKIARDVQAGMGDTALMEKYELTPKQLEKVLRMLLDCDLITHMQLYERISLSDSIVSRAFVEAKEAQRELDTTS